MRRVAFALAMVACASEDPCALDVPVASIDEAIALVNALPESSITCYVSALARPLQVELTSNVFSLQPAPSRRSPRVFLSEGPLVTSIVVAGDASHLMEFGELRDDGLSLKAELAFPIDPPVTRSDAFLRTRDIQGTSCGVCHANEIKAAPGEFASVPLRPNPGSVVPLETLVSEHEGCNPLEDEGRCAMLSALFDHGEVTHHPLPATYPF
ncbi:MAG: hypothetical protein AAGA48_12710 [Myxococcota bacterium]